LENRRSKGGKRKIEALTIREFFGTRVSKKGKLGFWESVSKGEIAYRWKVHEEEM